MWIGGLLLHKYAAFIPDTARNGVQSLLCVREKLEPLDCSMQDCDLRESTAMEALKQNLSGENGQLRKYLIGLPRLENNLTSSVNFREALPRLLGASFTGPERYEGILRQRMYERMAHDAYLAILP